MALLSLLSELDKHLVQPLQKNIHFFSLHPNGCCHSEVDSGVAVVVGAPVGEHVWPNGLALSWSNNPWKK